MRRGPECHSKSRNFLHTLQNCVNRPAYDSFYQLKVLYADQPFVQIVPPFQVSRMSQSGAAQMPPLPSRLALGCAALHERCLCGPNHELWLDPFMELLLCQIAQIEGRGL